MSHTCPIFSPYIRHFCLDFPLHPKCVIICGIMCKGHPFPCGREYEILDRRVSHRNKNRVARLALFRPFYFQRTCLKQPDGFFYRIRRSTFPIVHCATSRSICPYIWRASRSSGIIVRISTRNGYSRIIPPRNMKSSPVPPLSGSINDNISARSFRILPFSQSSLSDVFFQTYRILVIG